MHMRMLGSRCPADDGKHRTGCRPRQVEGSDRLPGVFRLPRGGERVPCARRRLPSQLDTLVALPCEHYRAGVIDRELWCGVRFGAELGRQGIIQTLPASRLKACYPDQSGVFALAPGDGRLGVCIDDQVREPGAGCRVQWRERLPFAASELRDADGGRAVVRLFPCDRGGCRLCSAAAVGELRDARCPCLQWGRIPERQVPGDAGRFGGVAGPVAQTRCDRKGQAGRQAGRCGDRNRQPVALAVNLILEVDRTAFCRELQARWDAVWVECFGESQSDRLPHPDVDGPRVRRASDQARGRAVRKLVAAILGHVRVRAKPAVGGYGGPCVAAVVCVAWVASPGAVQLSRVERGRPGHSSVPRRAGLVQSTAIPSPVGTVDTAHHDGESCQLEAAAATIGPSNHPRRASLLHHDDFILLLVDQHQVQVVVGVHVQKERTRGCAGGIHAL